MDGNRIDDGNRACRYSQIDRSLENEQSVKVGQDKASDGMGEDGEGRRVDVML